MSKKNIGEESYLEFRQGSFDNWCVFYNSGKEFYGYPKYFTYMQDLYPSIYNAFLLIYDLTDAEYSDRLYGQRRGKRKTETIIKDLTNENS